MNYVAVFVQREATACRTTAPQFRSEDAEGTLQELLGYWFLSCLLPVPPTGDCRKAVAVSAPPPTRLLSDESRVAEQSLLPRPLKQQFAELLV